MTVAWEPNIQSEMFFKKQKSILARQIEAALPSGMALPEPLEKLFNWIDRKGWTDQYNGQAWGSLGAPGRSKFETAPYIEFFPDNQDDLKYWFETDNPEIRKRLYVFAKIGADGSMGAFWLDDNGDQKIVLMGSGSGSTVICVLADDPVDFLRLLAIGYEEICWGEFDEKPDSEVPVNKVFQNWVASEFDVEIPETGKEIVPTVSHMHSKESDDPFWRWTRRVCDWDV